MTSFQRDKFIPILLMIPMTDLADTFIMSSFEQHRRQQINKKSDQILAPSTNITQHSSSLPVYYGSIIRIEQYSSSNNLSDLIVRITNFQYQNYQSIDVPNKPEIVENQVISTMARLHGKKKRRAPICPGLTENNSRMHSAEYISATSSKFDNDRIDIIKSSTNSLNMHRFSSGIRSLSRALVLGRRTKPAVPIYETACLSSLPDIEVLKSDIPTSRSFYKSKSAYMASPTAKFDSFNVNTVNNKEKNNDDYVREPIVPEINNISKPDQILLDDHLESAKVAISHKGLRITSFLDQKVDQQVTNSINLTNNDSLKADIEDSLQQNISTDLISEITQSIPALSNLIKSVPVTSIEGQSLSTHRYSTISGIVSDIRNIVADSEIDDVSTVLNPISIITASQLNQKDVHSTITDDLRLSVRPFRVQTTTLKPDVSVIRMGNNDSIRANVQVLGDPDEQTTGFSSNNLYEKTMNDDPYENQWYQINFGQEDILSEFYEVTYQLDPLGNGFCVSGENSKQYVSSCSSIDTIIEMEKNISDTKSTVQSPSLLVPWMQDSSNVSSNDYEQIDQQTIESSISSLEDHSDDKKARSIEYLPSIMKESGVNDTRKDITKTRSLENVARSSFNSPIWILDQSPNVESQDRLAEQKAGKKRQYEYYDNGNELFDANTFSSDDTDRLCISSTSIVDEEYTVILEMVGDPSDRSSSGFQIIDGNDFDKVHQEFEQFYSTTKLAE